MFKKGIIGYTSGAIDPGTNTHSIDLELSSSQYLSITDASQTGLNPTGDMTAEWWVRFESFGTNQVFVAKDNGTIREYVFFLDGPSRKLKGFVWDGTANATQVVSTTEIVAIGEIGLWVHMAVSFNSTTGAFLMYKNGTIIGSTTTVGSYTAPNLNSTAPFSIGATTNPALYVDGLMDEVRLWSDIRTATEINDNKGIQLIGNETNLEGYWQFNNDLLDKTSNNNDLINNGGAVFSTLNPFSGNTYAVWNASDKSADITLTNGNLTAENTGTGWDGVRSTISKTSGKWYWEIIIDSGGIESISGIANSSATLTHFLGSDVNGWGYYGNNGNKTNGGLSVYGASYIAGDIIGIALDLDTNDIEFFKNNVSQGVAFTGLTGTYFAMTTPIAGVKSTTNFGETTLTYTPPSGFNAGLYT